MTSQLDASGDLVAVADQLEPVTLRPRGGGAVVCVAHALRLAASDREMDSSGGKLSVGDVVWHLPMSELASPPQVGAVIVAGDQRRWTILEVLESRLSGRWRAGCRDLALAHGLRDVVRLQQARWTKGASGALSVSWQDQQFGIAARLVPGPAAAVIERDRVALREPLTVLLAEAVPIGGRQRIIDSTGQVYDIERFEPADRVELPHVLHVVRRTSMDEEMIP